MAFEFLTDKQIEREAERLRQDALGIRANDLPVDVEGIAFDYLATTDNLILCDDVELPDEHGEEVLGKLDVIAGRIHINARLRSEPGRYRFTLAHELGHWRLHRHHLLALQNQPSLFASHPGANGPTMTTLNRAVTSLKPPREEIQANRFAAALLVSPAALRREVALRFGEQGISKLLASEPGASRRAQGRTIALVQVGSYPGLAAAFAVSAEAMAIALDYRGYLSPAPLGLF
jgi:Zn-dependent peptidase ImmA (M78 family)